MTHVSPEVKAIADALDVRINAESWDVTHIGIERYEEHGPQWVRLEVILAGRTHRYQIARKEMVKAWTAIDRRGISDVEGMPVFIDGKKWVPVSTAILEIHQERFVELVLESVDKSQRQIVQIDYRGLVNAYFALRTSVELIEDAKEVFAYLSQN